MKSRNRSRSATCIGSPPTIGRARGACPRRAAQGTPPTGKRVAIVGAGPAGLAAAYHLLRRGHGVVLFDAHPQPGGMLRYGIPAFRLPRQVLDAEINVIRELGRRVPPGQAAGPRLHAGRPAAGLRRGVPGDRRPGLARPGLPGRRTGHCPPWSFSKSSPTARRRSWAAM